MKSYLLVTSIILITLYTLSSCTTNSELPPTSGTTEIIYDNIATGFLFQEGTSYTRAERPNTIPDFWIQVQTSQNGVVQGLFLVEPDLDPAFVLLSNVATADSANQYFDALSVFPDATLTELALPLKANQVWGVKTRNNNYAKILIKEVWATSDTSSSNLIIYKGSLTMKWKYQPDGSRKF